MKLRKIWNLYHLGRIRVVNITPIIETKGYQLKKSIHTNNWNFQRESTWDNTGANLNDDAEYELDLITMTKRKKETKNSNSTEKSENIKDAGSSNTNRKPENRDDKSSNSGRKSDIKDVKPSNSGKKSESKDAKSSTSSTKSEIKDAKSSNIQNEDHCSKRKNGADIDGHNLEFHVLLEKLNHKEWQKLKAKVTSCTDLFTLFDILYRKSQLATSNSGSSSTKKLSAEQNRLYDEFVKRNIDVLLNRALENLGDDYMNRTRATKLMNTVLSNLVLKRECGTSKSKGGKTVNSQSDNKADGNGKKVIPHSENQSLDLDELLLKLNDHEWEILKAHIENSPDLLTLSQVLTGKSTPEKLNKLKNQFRTFSHKQISTYNDFITQNLTPLLNNAILRANDVFAGKTRSSTILNIIYSHNKNKQQKSSKSTQQNESSEAKVESAEKATSNPVGVEVEIADKTPSDPAEVEAEVKTEELNSRLDEQMVSNKNVKSPETIISSPDSKSDDYLVIKEDGDLKDSNVDMFAPSSDHPQLKSSENTTIANQADSKSDNHLTDVGASVSQTSDTRMDDNLVIEKDKATHGNNHLTVAGGSSSVRHMGQTSDARIDDDLVFEEDKSTHSDKRSSSKKAVSSDPRLDQSLVSKQQDSPLSEFPIPQVRSDNILLNHATAAAGQTANKLDDVLVINEVESKDASEDMFAPYIRSDIEQLTKPSSTTIHEVNITESSNVKSDDHIASDNLSNVKPPSSDVDIRGDDFLAGLKDDEVAESMLNYDTSASGPYTQEQDPKSGYATEDQAIKTHNESVTNVHSQEPESVSDISNSRSSTGSDPEINPMTSSAESKNDGGKSTTDGNISNLFVPNVNEEKSVSGFHYNTSAPDIEELNELSNISKPVLFPSSDVKRVRKKNKDLLSELGHLTPREKIGKIGDIIELLEHEIPKLSREKNFSESEIREKSKKTEQLRKELEKLNQTEPEKLEKLDIPVESLEGFLENAKKTEDLKQEEKFRQEKAYESSKAMTDKNSRTIQKHNFFTPIDEALSKRVANSLSSIKVPEQGNPDDLFFPSIKQRANLTHEFLILTNKEKIITTENPLGDNYQPQDLLTIFKFLGISEKYLKQIIKLEKNGGWKLIGSGGDSEKILIFERYIDKELERKKLFRKRFKRSAWSVGIIFVLAYGFGHYFEHQQKVKYNVDKNGRAVKGTS